ncbi:MAG: hypothetical protein GY856_13125 [bacterium]|nr:hypothetical protein [bacterium]
MRTVYVLPLLFGSMLAGPAIPTEETMLIEKTTPILIVDEIEPSLELWVDRLGFEKAAEVLDGDRLGFVMLASGATTIMYQTRHAMEREIAEQGLPEEMRIHGASVLFIRVSDLDQIRRKLDGFEIIQPYRETPYGAHEIWIREPGGHLVGFAFFPRSNDSS